jgi:beta-lactamase class C
MKLKILFAFLIAISIGAVKAVSNNSTLPLLTKFETFVNKAMQEKKVPGLAVAIVLDGQIIFLKGFGVKTVGNPDPIDIQTVFQIGSASKAITSVLVSLLNREQIISLDHPIEIIPGATVRHVLSHTTGISSAGFNSLIEKGVPAHKVYDVVKTTLPTTQPGEKFAYHNVVYNLVEKVIEEQCDMSFSDVLKAYLLDPLNMKQTVSTWQEFIDKTNRVSVHAFTNGKGKKGKSIRNVQKVSYRRDYANFPAAGGCSSSIHDMALFLAAILGARPDVFSPQDLEQFINPLVHTPDQWHRSSAHRSRITETHYGLGWRTMTFGGHHLVFHGGWIRGINALISFIPEQKIGIVILQNAESGLPFALSMQFYDWFLNMPEKQWLR